MLDGYNKAILTNAHGITCDTSNTFNMLPAPTVQSAVWAIRSKLMEIKTHKCC